MIKFSNGETIPLEMHKARIVQKISLLPIEQRYQKLQDCHHNMYLLQNKDVFLDMLTDSGVNAMSDNQLAAMMNIDDSYAGSSTFTSLKEKVQELFDMEFFLPAHQGRACENILSTMLVKQGSVVAMNYHFTTTKAHIVKNGGKVVECLIDEGLQIASNHPFKGNFDLDKLRDVIAQNADIPFIRIEAGTNLIGGQPISLTNIREVSAIARAHGILLMMDASLLQDNLHFIKQREHPELTIREITSEIAKCLDIIYFSARKLGFAKGGGICMRDKNLFQKASELVVLNEGFLTYGGISTREMGAMVVGLEETMDEQIIAQGPMFIEYMVNQLSQLNVPVVTPAGGLGCHLDAKQFVSHLKQEEYPAAALASALYLISGIRTMERGTMSEDRNPDGTEKLAEMELVRCAIPRRVYSLSHVQYAIDRIAWLHKNRNLIGGLAFTREPSTLRFFLGELTPTSDWPAQLVNKFKQDFGDSL